MARTFTQWILSAMLFASMAFGAIGKPTNIVLIMADDLGYEALSVNGSESCKSPRLDQLAAEGIQFTNGFANPLCTPSRVKIMTGQYNLRNYVKFGTLDRGQKTFANQLKDAGYATCIAGKWQLGKNPQAPQHFGLIAIEREMDLNQYLENGVKLDSMYAHELLLTIFHPKTALHDGGMIMRDTRILGSACVFPVSQKELSDRSIGLRHRAGLGISEESDAIAIIVSEETGHISLCQNGNLEQDLEGEALKDRLNEMMGLSQKEEDPDDSNKSEEEAA